jgi:hypothetical protein
MAFLVAVKLLLTYHFPEDIFPHPSQKATFAWSFLGILTAVGLVGVWLSRRTGFPAMWDERVAAWQRFALPALVGVAFGVESILADRAWGLTKIVAERLNIRSFHMAFPASAFVYPGGAIIVDVLYHLVPLSLLVWLISNLLLRGRGQERVFWVVAVLLSAFEPVTQTGVLAPLFGKELMLKGHETLLVYMLLEGYAFNLAQAYFFRRYGFLACLTTRIAMYLVWHVLWG